jgi:hypothetical protein
MTTDTRKALYGAARKMKIRKTENDVVAECLPLMSETHVRSEIVSATGEELVMYRPAREVIIEKLEDAVYTIGRLKAGEPV